MAEGLIFHYLKGEFNTLLDIAYDFPGYPTTGAYLDSATLNLQPKTAIDAQSDYIRDVGTTVRMGLHKRSRKSESAYLKSKDTISIFLGGSAENYAWIPNADYGWNLILNLYREKWVGRKLKVITSIFEHHSLLAPLVHLQNVGAVEIQFLRTADEYNLENYISKELYRRLGKDINLIMDKTEYIPAERSGKFLSCISTIGQQMIRKGFSL